MDAFDEPTCADVYHPVTLAAPFHEAAAHQRDRCLRQPALCCHAQHLHAVWMHITRGQTTHGNRVRLPENCNNHRLSIKACVTGSSLL